MNHRVLEPPRDMEVESPEPIEQDSVENPAPIVIAPRQGWKALDLSELWRYRELLFFFAWRDVKVRYKQTILGAAWAIIQPFMMMVVFTIFLGRLAAVPAGDLPYPIFVYAGLLPWSFFSTAISNAGNSVIGQQQLVTKVYFPRLAIPFAAVGAAMVDFVIAFSVLILMMVYYGITPGWGVLLVPGLVGLTALAALGVGTILAALNVAYRDFRYVIPFLVQLWMFATPTIYMKAEVDATPVAQTASASPESSEAPEPDNEAAADGRKALPPVVKSILKLNPLTGVIRFFRAATLGGELPWQSLAYSTATILVVFGAGCFYFRRVEDSFADII